LVSSCSVPQRCFPAPLPVQADLRSVTLVLQRASRMPDAKSPERRFEPSAPSPRGHRDAPAPPRHRLARAPARCSGSAWTASCRDGVSRVARSRSKRDAAPPGQRSAASVGGPRVRAR
jgi:hypothetical protein